MTEQSQVIHDEKYRPVLDQGFVGIVDVMGNDAAIVQAARVSYGEGTKKVQDDRNLIRYLMRHQHSTPFEMVEFKLHMKLPIFVARQLIRHRTASVNEYSGRYSVMMDSFYCPAEKDILPQSKDNKQGRGGNIDVEKQKAVKSDISLYNSQAYDHYQELLGTEDEPGIAKELARIILPVSNYTEWYWKCDLKNIFGFLRLRMDSHAQYEIREYADAMFHLMRPYVPVAFEAFEDYMLNAQTMSRMEMGILRQMAQPSDDELKDAGLGVREIAEFKQKMGWSH